MSPLSDTDVACSTFVGDPCEDADVTVAEDVADSLRDDSHYLGRCQHDTPSDLVSLAWFQVSQRRIAIDSVVDFGAGDGRFAMPGKFKTYRGYEIDRRRISPSLPSGVEIVADCAFSHQTRTADVCIGNPPYVRNQDLPGGWRAMAAAEIENRTGVRLSGLANAWQYFLMLALWSVKPDGLVVQIVPFEWVYRPAARSVREYVSDHGWAVDVYRLPDGTFGDVLTSASITVIDKARIGGWRYYEMSVDGTATLLPSPTGSGEGVLAYTRATDPELPAARRGLSPGTQKALTLTEAERVHAGLHIGVDVVRCVTSLRMLPPAISDLDAEAFKSYFVEQGAKCWLIRTDRSPSDRLTRYLAAVNPELYQTATCLGRVDWWRFSMPPIPAALVAQTFKGTGSPKAVVNSVGARAVGGISGVHNLDLRSAASLTQHIRSSEFQGRLVEYASGLQKLEINQLNTIVAAWHSAEAVND